MAKLKDSDSNYDSDLDLETESKSNAKLMRTLKKLHSERIWIKILLLLLIDIIDDY